MQNILKRLSTFCLFLFCGLWQSMLSYGEKKEGHIISSDGAPIMDVLVTVINNADSTTLCMTSTDNKVYTFLIYLTIIIQMIFNSIH